MSAPPNARTQQGNILQLLKEANGGWVPLPKILACAAQYNARLFDLRRQGFKIENRTEIVKGVRHSWFRLVGSQQHKSAEPIASSYMRRIEEEQAAAMPLFSGTACQ